MTRAHNGSSNDLNDEVPGSSFMLRRGNVSQLGTDPFLFPAGSCGSMETKQKRGEQGGNRIGLAIPRVACFLCMMISAQIGFAGAPPSFVLKGSFETVFRGERQDAGLFTVNASGSKALVDVVHENGYREVVGTDGVDSYTYRPFTGPTSITNPCAEAIIVGGRFPDKAHVYAQMLWLMSTIDDDSQNALHETTFSFYGNYLPNEITVVVELSEGSPRLLRSIRWYAPNLFASGTNRYELTEYPSGWLMADASVTKTEDIQGMKLPTGMAFTQYATRAIANPANLTTMQMRGSNDVQLVGQVLFQVNDAGTAAQLSTYVPEIPDVPVRVYDERIDKLVMVEAGKWWTASKHLRTRSTVTQQNGARIVVVAIIMLLSGAAFFRLVKYLTTPEGM